MTHLLAALEVEEDRDDEHCQCCGDPTLALYQGDRLLVSLGIHQGEHLSWPGEWPNQAKLTAQGASRLKVFLEKLGHRRTTTRR